MELHLIQSREHLASSLNRDAQQNAMTHFSVMQRSFIRDYLKLTAAIEQDFKGQVELLPVKEDNFTSFAFIIRPKKGFYAHAAFRFVVTTTEGYPNEAPDVSCINPPWHPNIHPRLIESNICLNILSYWSRGNDLKSLISALVFLFYEPNFDDPIHHHGDYKDLGKREQLIRLSLVGGTIDDIVFKPNNEWCLWAEDNLLPSTAPTEASPSFVPSVAEVCIGTREVSAPVSHYNSSTLLSMCYLPAPHIGRKNASGAVDRIEEERDETTLVNSGLSKLTGEAQSQLPSADAPTELQREVSSLSAYYQSNAPIEFDQFSRIDPEFLDLFTEANCLPFYTENAFLCHISLQPKNSSLAICEHTFCGCPTRYYYAEMCSHGYSMYLASWLDDSHGPALSLHILHTETPLQKAEIGIWNPLSREDGELLERLRQLFYGYKKVVEQNNGLVSDEQISESRSVNLSEENNEELETKCVIESESSVCGAGDTRRNNEVQTQVPVHSVDSGITNQLVSEAENVTGLVVFPNVAEQIESTLAAKPDEDDSNPSSPQVTEVEDFVEEPLEVQTAPVPGSDGSQLEDYSHSPDADQNTYDLNNTDHELRTMLYATQYESNRLINRRKGLKLLFSLLRPFWWIFYQTRWPPFLAPGYLFTVNDDFIRYFGSYFYPASACQLAFELYNHRPRAEEPVPLILIDSLYACDIREYTIFICPYSDFYTTRTFGSYDTYHYSNYHIWRRGPEFFSLFITMLSELESLSVHSTAREVEDYLERFSIWCLTKSDLGDEKKTACLLHYIGKDAYALVKNSSFPTAPIDCTFDVLKKLILSHFKPINFVAAERAKFNSLIRSESQSIRDFVLQLQTQAAKCDYGQQLESQLSDRLIAGINLPDLQQKLLVQTDQRFISIRKICEQYQDVKEVTKCNETVLFNALKSKGLEGRPHVKVSSGNFVDCNFLVSNSGPSIIGLKVLRALNVNISLLTSNFNETELKQLITSCSKVTGGMRIPKVKLEVSGDPIFLKRRIVPFGLREPVRLALDSLCQKGILTPVESSKWATPIVTPLKSDGKTVRICGDYRLTLNKSLLQRSCATEEPEDVLYRLAGSKIFSKIDLKDAYLQIPLDDATSECTVINTPFGLYRYNFLPFGLNVSPAVFQDVINSITDGLEGVVTYQDDVIVHAVDKVTHDSRLLALFKRFHDLNVAVNSSKCAFSVYKLSCLGYTVDGNGFSPDNERLSPLVNAPSPSNLSELRSILGALQYYSRFIPNFSQKAYCLFELLSLKTFSWISEHEKTLRSLLNYLKSDAILKPFSAKDHSTVITDASPTGLGVILEQNGRPVICASRRLTQAEQGYSQTQREALAVYWGVSRLHKYLFGKPFTIVTDHEALKFIYHPMKSLAKSSAAMVQRWSIALSSYTYDIIHRGAKSIQHVDYLSRVPESLSQSNVSDCLLVQPLPIKRDELVRDTRKYFSSVISALRRGWTHQERRRFPAFYARRDSLALTPDGLLCYNDRVVIPPTHRSAILSDLHSGHLGIDKMKSLARLTCWWPELDADIARTAKDCMNCTHKIHSKSSKWIPWPLSCETWQRIHADYCGPFLNKYYALVVVDSYSRWTEVFLTTSPSSEFTQYALRKLFSREGVPIVLVTDNGSHFTAKSLEYWLKGLGCRHLFTAPRHPQSNGLAENFVRTLKSAINSISPVTFHDLDRGIDNFLMQYRNAAHSITGKSPAELFKSRSLRTNLECIGTADVTFFKGNDLRPSTGVVIGRNGNRMVTVLDLEDLSSHRRHVDQVEFNARGMRIFLEQVTLRPAPVEELYRTIVQKVHEADATFVPRRPARSRMNRKLPKRIRRLLEKRSQLFFKKLTTGDTEDELAFRKMRNRSQHGFLPNRSCVTNMVVFMNSLTQAKDEGLILDAIFFDSSKAFDRVPHVSLLHKLESYRIQGKILRWIKAFLSARSFRVKVDSTYCSPSLVSIGVPQGSFMGPVPFPIYVNGLPDVPASPRLLFADELKSWSSNFSALQMDQQEQESAPGNSAGEVVSKILRPHRWSCSASLDTFSALGGYDEVVTIPCCGWWNAFMTTTFSDTDGFILHRITGIPRENSLKSMASALVFLFYEPNFEDPVHFIGACILPEERGKFVRLSLAGGSIDSIYFQTNEEWCHWAAENSLLPADPMELSSSTVPPATKNATAVIELTGPSLSRFQLRTSGDAKAAAAGYGGVYIVLSDRAEVSLLDWIPVNNRPGATEELEEEENAGIVRRLFHLTCWTGSLRPVVSETFRDQNGSLISSKVERLNRWAQYFGQHFTWPPNTSKPDYRPTTERITMNIEPHSASEKFECISPLNRHRAPGPDDLPSALFKDGDKLFACQKNVFLSCFSQLDEGTQLGLFSVNAPTELQHQVSSLSTYYQTNAPIEDDHFDLFDLDFTDVFTDVNYSPLEKENAFLHHITVQKQETSPHSIHERALWHDFVRYYYAEVCSSEYHIYLSSWLHECFGPTVAQQLFRLPKPLQKTELGIWYPFHKEGEVLAALRRLPRDHTEDGGDTSSLMAPEMTNGEENANSHEEHDDRLHAQNNTGNGLIVGGVNGGLENGLIHMVVTPTAVGSGVYNNNAVDMNDLQAFSDVTVSKSAEHPPTVLMVKPEKYDDPAASLSGIRVSELDESVVTSSESKATPVGDSGDSQTEETISQSIGGDTNGTRDDFVAVFEVGQYEGAILLKRRGALRLLLSLLRPFWWIFYQTRWPPFLAPGFVCIVGDELIKCFGNYFYPASAFQLMLELYNHRMRERERTSLILVDPLALSPFSPVLNRVVLLPSDGITRDDAFGEKFACSSIEWIAPAQSFSNCFHRPTEEQFPGFTILSVLSLVSNWLAYLSRIELRGIVVGYSQYRDTYTVRPMGLACMYPATLGCGQLPLLDAWPLQLLVHSTRTCCSTLVYLSSRLSPRSNFPNPRLLFSFTDVDNL
ncbi:hypothetical protein T265_07798 [Opisthorchis viverrini]|uniref:Reverse transcriptase n=1 Tax=Opisthorchis viverrini TaxID=6198 RepID=A0A074ZB91_OPIVI|nr:hypothetical protein T265_07798 [Opisthorchis viverrini]KER24566.1 hypothetical protein T265_07798 [Opisthorchis viverrini]